VQVETGYNYAIFSHMDSGTEFMSTSFAGTWPDGRMRMSNVMRRGMQKQTAINMTTSSKSGASSWAYDRYRRADANT
jgi:hypothetical protein